MTSPLVLEILPPQETFSPEAAGAIALMVARLFARPGRFTPVVAGAPTLHPFAGPQFVPIRPALRPLPRALRYAIGADRWVRRLNPALIEVHNRPDIAFFLARRHPGLPVALYLQNDPRAMRGARHPEERRRLLERLAGIGAASSYLARCFREGLGDEAGPIEIIANCIDPSALPPSPPVREPLILYAGRVVADKGVDGFIAACARVLPELPGWRAEIIGADRFGPESPRTPFLARMEEQARSAGVVMRGYQPHPLVLEAMARAAIVVMPSRWAEPFGLVALEAMASGAALITSARGALPEVVGDAALFADPDRPETIAEAIRRLAQDADERARLSARGRERAAAFSIAAITPRLEAFRARLLERR
jgi:UDP-glucose:(glucosyl)LPS alpha-1,2-glucosyltransferase